MSTHSANVPAMISTRGRSYRDARVHLKEVLDDAVTGHVTIINRWRKPAAVVVPVETWEALLASVPSCSHERSSRDLTA
jgi:prevent-host-death family protein